MASPSERSSSFGSVAADYDRLRSEPLSAAVEWLLPVQREVLVDLGAGTGLFSRALAGLAARVIAIEPDDRMRAVLRARSPGVEVIAARGEAIPLPDASADGIFASSAWHWMDADQAVPQVARVLRDGGRFGLIWTGRDRDAPWLRADDWFREVARDGDPFSADTSRGRGSRHSPVPPDAAPFTNIETRTFRFTRRMSPSDLVGMLTTYSRVITASPEVRERGRARAADALARAFPGATKIDVPMWSRCWRADRVARELR